MKKWIGALLVLCMLCGMSALAATDGTITGTAGYATSRLSYTVPRRMNYTLTIPASLNLDVKQGERFSSTMKIALKDTDFSAMGSRVRVSLSGAGFALKNGKTEIPYTVNYQEKAVELGAYVLEWIYAPETAAEASSDLVISGTAPSVLPNGTYTDVLTFTVKAEHPDDFAVQEQ